MEGFDWLCLFDQTGFYLRNVIFFFCSWGEKQIAETHKNVEICLLSWRQARFLSANQSSSLVAELLRK